MTAERAAPLVSVIVPARNAASTLPDTIAALLSQTSTDWEAIIINDGSTDLTAAIARDAAALDDRIRILATPGLGAAAARNLGIRMAAGAWLLFLDADDWVLPTFVERLTQGAADNFGAAAIYCGWMRVSPSGQIVSRDLLAVTADIYPTVARSCPFAIHSCIVSAAEVRLAGGFDEALVVCEDWDLWQRIARGGARFVQVTEFLACYRMRENSASIDARQMLVDGLRVITRGHAADARVDAGRATWPNGLPSTNLARTRLGFCCWSAGIAISTGQDPVELLSLVADDHSPEVDPWVVADTLFRSIPLRSCRGPEAWGDLWPVFETAVERFVDALERHAGTPRLRARTMAALVRLILEHSPVFPRSAGRHHAFAIDASRRIDALALPAGCERVLIVVTWGDSRLGTLELPVCDGTVSAQVLSDAVAAKYMWPMLARLLAPVHASLEVVRRRGRIAIHRGKVCLAADVNEHELIGERLHDRVGWTVFLQELFDRPGLTDAQFYDESWADPHRAPVRRMRDGEWVRIEAASEVPSLKGPAANVLALLTVGGAAIALLPLNVGRKALPAQALRARLIIAGGLELARAAMREGVLLASNGSSVSWRAQLLQRAAEASVPAGDVQSRPGDPGFVSDDALVQARVDDPASMLIGRRVGLPVGSSASRRAAFPAVVGCEVREAALAAGELVVERRQGSPDAPVVYVPELFSALAPPSTLATAAVAGTAASGFGRHHFETLFASPDPWKYTTAYEQTKYDQSLALLPRQPIERALEVGCAEGHFTAQLASHVGRLLATDISHIALNHARERCRDCANVSFERIDLVADALPPDQDLVVCSEMLYYVGDRRALAVVGGKLRDALKPGGYLLSAHANTTSDGEDGAAFEWDVPFGAKTIGDVISRVAGLTRIGEVRTALYRIFLFRRSDTNGRHRFNPFARGSSPVRIVEARHAQLTPEVGAHVRWHKSASRGLPAPAIATAHLPILMYHRIAAAGAEGTAPYRVAPADFEDQLRYLRDGGFRSISLEEWHQATAARRPVDGRAVVVTFDDGYEDFEDEAWPLLRKYGFGAVVFLVSDLVGGNNSWDIDRGESVRLMDWPAIARLEASGVEFGAHSATHQAMTALSPADMVREASRCRTTLLSRLRRPVTAFAYPFGDTDGVVQHLVGACGYQFGVTCETRRCRPQDPMMALPRIEVRGGQTHSEFIARLSAG